MRGTEVSTEVDTSPSNAYNSVGELLQIRKETSTRLGSFSFAKNAYQNRVPLHQELISAIAELHLSRRILAVLCMNDHT